MNMHKKEEEGDLNSLSKTDVSIEQLLNIKGNVGALPPVCNWAAVKIQENFSGCLGAVVSKVSRTRGVRCSHGNSQINIYTPLLYIYTKLTARESRICSRVFFQTKIWESLKKRINSWVSIHRQNNIITEPSPPCPWGKQNEICRISIFLHNRVWNIYKQL